MANATNDLFPPPYNQTSKGAIGCLQVCIDIDNGVWVLSLNGTPVNGVAGTGTGAGFAAPGSLAIDRVGKGLYQNTGTLASPVWTPISQSLLTFGGTLSNLGFKNADGTAMAATAASGKFGVSVTLGTSLFLVGEAATSSGPLTDNAIIEVVLPESYQPGTNVNVLVNAQKVGAGTTTTATVLAKAYADANNGTQGANLIATAAATVTASAADYTFVITGTSLVAGQRVTLEITSAITETAGTATHIQVNSVRYN